MSAYSAGAYTATLLVMVNVKKGGGRAPPPSPARTNFTLITECTPESSGCSSVYSVPVASQYNDNLLSNWLGLSLVPLSCPIPSVAALAISTGPRGVTPGVSMPEDYTAGS